MTCVKLVKAILARAMFAIHALIAIWRLAQQGRLGWIGCTNLRNCEFHTFNTVSEGCLQVKIYGKSSYSINIIVPPAILNIPNRGE